MKGRERERVQQYSWNSQNSWWEREGMRECLLDKGSNIWRGKEELLRPEVDKNLNILPANALPSLILAGSVAWWNGTGFCVLTIHLPGRIPLCLCVSCCSYLQKFLMLAFYLPCKKEQGKLVTQDNISLFNTFYSFGVAHWVINFKYKFFIFLACIDSVLNMTCTGILWCISWQNSVFKNKN